MSVKQKTLSVLLASSLLAIPIGTQFTLVNQAHAAAPVLSEDDEQKIQDIIDRLNENGGYDKMLEFADEIQKAGYKDDLLALFGWDSVDYPIRNAETGVVVFQNADEAYEFAILLVQMIESPLLFTEDIENFRQNNSELFHRVFGDDVNVALLKDFANQVLTSAQLILFDNIEDLSGISPTSLARDAVEDALESFPSLVGKLSNIGLSVNELVSAKEGLYDIDGVGDLAIEVRDAMAEAYAHQYIKVVKSGTNTYQSPLSVQVNHHLNLDMLVTLPIGEGVDIPFLNTLPSGLEWATEGSITIDENGSITTGSSASTGNKVHVKWNNTPIATVTVNVTAAPGSGSGSDSGTVQPPAPPTPPTPPTTPSTPSPTENSRNAGAEIGQQINDAIQQGNLEPGKIANIVEGINNQLTTGTEAEKQAVIDGLQSSLSTLSNSLAGKTAEETKQALDSVVSVVKGVQATASTVESDLGKVAAQVGAEYVKKVAQEELKATVQDGKAVAKADAEQLKQVVAKAAEALAEVNQKLADAGITDAPVETVLTFAVQGEDTNATEASFGIEALQDALKDVKNDSTFIEVQSGGVSVKISIEDILNALTAKASLSAVAEAEYKIETVKSELTEQPDSTFTMLTGVKVVEVKASSNGKEVSSFQKAIEVSIQVGELPQGINAEKVSAFKWVDGKWQPVAGVYHEGVVTFKTKEAGKFTVFASNKSFADLDSVKSWAQNEVEVMAAKGIVNGRSESKYDPSANVTRAEFAKLVVRALGLYDPKAVVSFSDVKDSDWYYGDVATAARLGIVTGVTADKFNPNALISREEMATMAARALKLSGLSVKKIDERLASFSDKDQVQAWAKEAVALNVKYGVIKGISDGSFSPKKKATRAEAAVIMYRMFHAK